MPSSVRVTYHQSPNATGADMSVSWTRERISWKICSIVGSWAANHAVE